MLPDTHIMRNGLTGLASVALLGGVLAVGGTSMPERTAVPAEDAAGDARLKPAATYVITPDTIDCTTFISENTCQASLVIRVPQNGEARVVSLGATLTTPSGNAAEATVAIIGSDGRTTNTVDLSGKSAAVVKVQLTFPKGWRRDWPPSVASGVLGILSDNNRYEGTPKRLRVLAPSGSRWQTTVVLLPAALSLLVALAAAVYLRRNGIGLLDRMGAPNWRASESWSSNLTVGAGLANGVLALAVISDLTVFMTKPAYGVVTMLLSALVILAPIVYGLFRRARTAQESTVEPTVATRLQLLQPAAKEQFDGYVVMFLAAAALTLWASGGQLLTFALLIGELWSAAALNTPVAVVIVGLVLMVFVALFVYGGKSMAAAPVKTQAMLNAQTRQSGREGVIAPARVPEWSLL
jgi:hypothetical protein